jgi:DUF4097 and DUF4098 domain-containing protein YvlB
MRLWLQTYRLIIIGSVAVCLVLPAAAIGQSAPKARTVILSSDLDQAAQDLADEYADVLEKLQDVISDYTDYLSEIGDKDLTTSLSFERFSKAYQNGDYAADPNKLSSDLTAYLEKLGVIEKECAQGNTARSAKSCRVVRSLKREMNVVEEQVQAHLEHLNSADVSSREVQEALKRVAELSKAMSKEYAEVLRKAMEKAADKLQRIDMTVPNAPHVITTPKPPSGRVPVPIKKGSHAEYPGEVGTKRSASGTISVTSMNLPVYITNPNGSIEVTGTSEKTIDVSFDLEVSASSRAREKELASAIGLKIWSADDGYRVEVTVPRLSDPETKILENSLVVSVPAGLRLVCKNAYGDVTVSDMTGQVSAVTSYSSIDLSSCRGGAQVTNSMGSITLSDCAGGMLVRNSYGNIDLSDCNGDIDVANSYAPITLSNTRGKAIIVNTGQITIDEHVGPVSISNQYGEVTIENVQGSLQIQNAYQAVTVSNISGQTQIENNYSPITVSGLKGRTKLLTRFATITAEDLRGPFDVSCQNGSVELSLTEQPDGASKISATFGAIRLSVPRPINMLINARTSFGEISSSLPVKLSSDGTNRSAVIRLGTGRDSLSIVGTNSAIDITDSR